MITNTPTLHATRRWVFQSQPTRCLCFHGVCMRFRPHAVWHPLLAYTNPSVYVVCVRCDCTGHIALFRKTLATTKRKFPKNLQALPYRSQKTCKQTTPKRYRQVRACVQCSALIASAREHSCSSCSPLAPHQAVTNSPRGRV